MKQCNIENCTGLVVAKGMCQKHYRRMERYGNPMVLLKSPNGEGGMQSGYFKITVNGKRIKRSVIVAEKMIGGKLPEGAVVHHIDGNKINDDPANLIICKNNSDHMLLHQKEKALRECGHADWYRCHICGIYSPLEEIKHYKNQSSYHPQCERNRSKERRTNRRINLAGGQDGLSN